MCQSPRPPRRVIRVIASLSFKIKIPLDSPLWAPQTVHRDVSSLAHVTKLSTLPHSSALSRPKEQTKISLFFRQSCLIFLGSFWNRLPLRVVEGRSLPRPPPGQYLFFLSQRRRVRRVGEVLQSTGHRNGHGADRVHFSKTADNAWDHWTMVNTATGSGQHLESSKKAPQKPSKFRRRGKYLAKGNTATGTEWPLGVSRGSRQKSWGNF